MEGIAIPRHSIRQTFDDLRAKQRLALVPFLPAGFPDLQTTVACLPALQSAGASIVEIGFPFSDPIADGTVIQEAFTAALQRKISVAQIFGALADAQERVTLPLVAMVSFSIVFRYGLSRFAEDAKLAGFDAMIVPDLPPPEAQRVCDAIRAAALDTILLVAPTTPPQRRAEIARLSSGFVYYLSVAGITGERDRLPPDLQTNVRELRSHTDRPICVGFGIHTQRHIAQLQGLADGAIVGTAYVRRIQQHANEGIERISHVLADYTRELLGS